ncbi:hypothetical protein QO034_10630 [Sedimentitalea sp. JM2-8]|uniref:Pentapeptide repeat-containing protein n=1 Tax=Sedimentitalea xiamensis TaxID=3050037 RepID=A0ABT7FEL4_9RHOB|nr:hypothetical protein [Sedimentitalea xiamensis]MDK3073566.1 hypothetical protein [Sedimentitalea xiamensis]
MGIDLIAIESGAADFSELRITDFAEGAMIRFADVSIVLSGVSSTGLTGADFDF